MQVHKIIKYSPAWTALIILPKSYKKLFHITKVANKNSENNITQYYLQK